MSKRAVCSRWLLLAVVLCCTWLISAETTAQKSTINTAKMATGHHAQSLSSMLTSQSLPLDFNVLDFKQASRQAAELEEAEEVEELTMEPTLEPSMEPSQEVGEETDSPSLAIDSLPGVGWSYVEVFEAMDGASSACESSDKRVVSVDAMPTGKCSPDENQLGRSVMYGCDENSGYVLLFSGSQCTLQALIDVEVFALGCHDADSKQYKCSSNTEFPIPDDVPFIVTSYYFRLEAELNPSSCSGTPNMIHGELDNVCIPMDNAGSQLNEYPYMRQYSSNDCMGNSAISVMFPTTCTEASSDEGTVINQFVYSELFNAYNVPSMEPTTESTLESTEEVTTDSTVLVTSEPSEAPTASPTAFPSASPTAGPTAAPTPTGMPSAVPIDAPTVSPSLVPVQVPTARPSPVPTSDPTFLATNVAPTVVTVVPSETPTARRPSARPTNKPTPVPSFAANAPTPPPSASVKQSLSFTVEQSFQGISKSQYMADIDNNNRAFKKTIKSLLQGVEEDNINIDDVKDSVRRRQLLSDASEIKLLADAGVVIIYTILIPDTLSAGFTNADDAFAQVKQQLQEAASSGDFTAKLQEIANELGVTILAQVVAGDVAVSDPVIITIPVDADPVAADSSSKDELNDGEIAGIVVGSVVFAGLLIGLAYYLMLQQGGGKQGSGKVQPAEVPLASVVPGSHGNNSVVPAANDQMQLVKTGSHTMAV